MAELERERIRRIEAQAELILYAIRCRYEGDLSPSLIARIYSVCAECDRIGQQYQLDCAEHAAKGEVTKQHTIPGFMKMSEEKLDVET